MSLDQFGISPNKKSKKKTTKKKSTTKINKPKSKKTSSTASPKSTPQTDIGDRKKFNLKCTNKTCGYSRSIRKIKLNTDDYICRKCGKLMKEV